MSFFIQNILRPARQPNLISSLANSLRTLSVTSYTPQRKVAEPAIVVPEPTTSSKNVLSLTPKEQSECQRVFDKVNKQLRDGEEGRLFAVVHLCGKQFKITPGDIILVEGYWPPNIGDEIRLEKVLLAGAKDFTMIGRPVLESGLVNVKATIIEKTLSHTKTHFKKKRRKQYLRINFQRSPNTMIRINTIEIGKKIEESSNDATNEIRLF